MKKLKRPLSFEEQVEKLSEHNMVIDDKEFAISILQKENYYRFTGYALQQRRNSHDSDYIDGTTFNNIYRICLFDHKMRGVLREFIEIAEIYYRTQISYGFSIKKCCDCPHDQHYQENNFYNKSGYEEVMRSFEQAKNYYKDSLIMQHHKDSYGGRLPLWAMVEMLSFSNLSKLYSCMYSSEQESIAQNVGTGHRMLKNHLHCLSVLRNKCAHAARLYNRSFNPPAMFNKSFLRNNPDIKTDTLFAYILVLLKRLPDENSKQRFSSAIFSVIEEFESDIDFQHIGFPSNYKDYLKG